MDRPDLPIYWLSDAFPSIITVASICTENDERERCQTGQVTLNNLLNTHMVSDLELTGVERVRWCGIESMVEYMDRIGRAQGKAQEWLAGLRGRSSFLAGSVLARD